jgi:hypothetical protein
MSLPSCAIIRNAAGEEIARQFVNVGWFVTAAALAQEFMFRVEDKGYVITDTIEAYNVILPIRILREVADVKELTERIAPFVERAEHKGERNVVVE